MAITVTVKNHRAAAFPIDESTYYFVEGMVPREGEHIHLHDQARLVFVNRVVYMAQEVPYEDGYGKRLACTAVVLVVTGTDPDRPWNGDYS